MCKANMVNVKIVSKQAGKIKFRSLIIVLVVGIVVFSVFFSWYAYNIKISGSIVPIAKKPHVEQNLFHPDQVLTLSFKFKQHGQNFSRKDRFQFWTSNADVNQRIQLTLNALAKMRPNMNEPSLSDKKIEITFYTDDAEKWEWSTDGSYYLWTSGPAKGRGGGLDSSDVEIFAGEEKLLQTGGVVLCDQRPKKFTFTADKVKEKTTLELDEKTHAWSLNGIAIRDQNIVEKWLGKHCKNKVLSYLSENSELVQLKKLDRHLQLIENNNSIKNLSWNSEGIIRLESGKNLYYFIDKKITQDLELLTSSFF